MPVTHVVTSVTDLRWFEIGCQWHHTLDLKWSKEEIDRASKLLLAGEDGPHRCGPLDTETKAVMDGEHQDAENQTGLRPVWFSPSPSSSATANNRVCPACLDTVSFTVRRQNGGMQIPKQVNRLWSVVLGLLSPSKPGVWFCDCSTHSH